MTIIGDLDWKGEERHLITLQAKRNTSLAFIESQEFFVRLNEELGAVDALKQVGVPGPTRIPWGQ